jgi:hypothetical protein
MVSGNSQQRIICSPRRRKIESGVDAMVKKKAAAPWFSKCQNLKPRLG